MKIVELCPFSQGICGVWTRVKSESLEFIKKGHEVLVLSSDIEKGTGNRTNILEENQEGIHIKRFKSTNDWIDKNLSENVIYWFNSETQKSINDFNPDVIITHLLHPHSAKISKLIPLLKRRNPSIKICIIPHAPFNIQRPFPLNLATWIWRKFSVLDLTKFDKVIAITKWEYPYLIKMGVDENKITYIPNGLPSQYFDKKTGKSTIKGDVLFLGRIAPVKNIELILRVAKSLPQVKFSIVGAWEKGYQEKLTSLLNESPNVAVYPPIYNLKEKISTIGAHTIFVLPSWREAMPQVILEAEASGSIVLSSETDGGKELIRPNENGFLFEKDSDFALKALIESNLKGNKRVQKIALKESKEFAWNNLINKYERLFV